MTNPAAGIPLLEDLPSVTGQHVLVRVDFNVPLSRVVDDATPQVEDDFRIRSALPTLQWLLERGASVTACTHLGRPKGKADPSYSVAPVRERLAELLPGVELMENLRFDPGEQSNDQSFVERLIKGFDLYVNDAFGVSHRAHASIVGPPSHLPSAAGRLLQREVEVLGGLLDSPRRPFVAVVGGAKVADKLGVLRALLGRVDLLLIGGGMSYTFLASKGMEVGESLLDSDHIEDCGRLMSEFGDRIQVPSDLKVVSGEQVKVVASSAIEPGWEAMDIGPETTASYAAEIESAATVFWNGPVGVFEDERFSRGTRTLAESMGKASGFTVVGGGDTASAFDHFGLEKSVDFVSTGGGAALELLETGDLVGLRALRHAVNAPATNARRPNVSESPGAASDAP